MAGDSLSLDFGAGEVVTLDPAQPLVRLFATAGEYTVAATHTAANSTVTSGVLVVKVIQASFGAPFPVYVGRPRVWSLPGIPAGVFVEPEANIYFVEAPPVAGIRKFDVNPVDAVPRNVLARISDFGSIAALGTVASLDVASSVTTQDMDVVFTYENGDRIYRMGLVADNLPPGGYIQLNIIVSGVTFSDGTLTKRFYAADFDANGVAYVYFNYPKNDLSVCHRLYVYDANGQLIGQR